MLLNLAAFSWRAAEVKDLDDHLSGDLSGELSGCSLKLPFKVLQVAFITSKSLILHLSGELSGTCRMLVRYLFGGHCLYSAKLFFP